MTYSMKVSETVTTNKESVYSIEDIIHIESRSGISKKRSNEIINYCDKYTGDVEIMAFTSLNYGDHRTDLKLRNLTWEQVQDIKDIFNSWDD